MLLLTASLPLAATEVDSSGIVFLQFRMDKDGVSLIEASVVPGSIKERRAGASPKAVYYEVESRDGSVIVDGSFDDPLVRRIEYEDPDSPGELKSEVIELAEARFVLRLNHSPDIESISFYRLHGGDKSSRKLLSRVRVNAHAERGE
jgi:hypothetical protein